MEARKGEDGQCEKIIFQAFKKAHDDVRDAIAETDELIQRHDEGYLLKLTDVWGR